MKMKIYNANPKGWKHEGDCVVRALSVATGYSWTETLETLSRIAVKMCRMPNSKQVYEKFLENEGWVKCKMPRHVDGKRFTIKEFIDLNHGELIISAAHHLTYASAGVLIDTWDCSGKSVGNYYMKEDRYDE